MGTPTDHDRTTDPGPVPADPPADGARLRGRAALKLHLTLAAGLTVCVGAFVIEVIRALDGNTLSWAYVFEWPILGSFGTYLWWSLLHGYDRRPRSRRPDADTSAPGAVRRGVRRGRAPEPVDAAALARWQSYLRDLGADEPQGATQPTRTEPRSERPNSS